MVIKTGGFSGKRVVIDNTSTLIKKTYVFKIGYFLQPLSMECINCQVENEVDVSFVMAGYMNNKFTLGNQQPGYNSNQI